jgi:hypothetical protein
VLERIFQVFRLRAAGRGAAALWGMIAVLGGLSDYRARAQGLEGAPSLEALFDVEGATTRDLSTGEAVSSIVMRIPPGRLQATPQLALRYRSGAGQSPVGYGWSLPIGSVRRSTRFGAPRCSGAHTDDFVLELDGEQVELVKSGGNLYRKAIEVEYGEAWAEPESNRWTYFDLAGRKYTFGSHESARSFELEDTFIDAASCAFTSRWELTRVEDPHGNTIDFEYAQLDAD